ncbi:MAG TPA: glycerophosphodiester phosphodiesterase family protein [Pyrinomonadaceae bacterium]|nr:glycerophosphodiester phosphodiesterase family protein [Pyrinomonadaceae bacterium]
MKIIAHRGASAHAPENTLAALRLALESGADGVEFDVQLARDGVPVVVHDETLMRYARRRDRIVDLTSQQLGRIDVGSWFNRRHRRRGNTEFSRETIPTLASVLDALKGLNGPVYIELKCNDTNFRRLSSAVCETVRDHPQFEHLIVKSFKLAVIPEVRHHLPSVKTAALFAPEIMHLLRRREHIIALAHEFGADQISVHHSLATPRLSRLASEAGVPLVVWTVDDPRWLRRRRSHDLYALITNDPGRFVKSRQPS